MREKVINIIEVFPGDRDLYFDKARCSISIQNGTILFNSDADIDIEIALGVLITNKNIQRFKTNTTTTTPIIKLVDGVVYRYNNNSVITSIDNFNTVRSIECSSYDELDQLCRICLGNGYDIKEIKKYLKRTYDFRYLKTK